MVIHLSDMHELREKIVMCQFRILFKEYGVIMWLENLSLESPLLTEYSSSSKSINSLKRFVLLVSECISSLRAYGIISSLALGISSDMIFLCISRIKSFTSECGLHPKTKNLQ